MGLFERGWFQPGKHMGYGSAVARLWKATNPAMALASYTIRRQDAEVFFGVDWGKGEDNTYEAVIQIPQGVDIEPIDHGNPMIVCDGCQQAWRLNNWEGGCKSCGAPLPVYAAKMMKAQLSAPKYQISSREQDPRRSSYTEGGVPPIESDLQKLCREYELLKAQKR